MLVRNRQKATIRCQNDTIVTFKYSGDLKTEHVIYSRLLRFSTARGSCTGLVAVGPTKV